MTPVKLIFMMHPATWRNVGIGLFYALILGCDASPNLQQNSSSTTDTASNSSNETTPSNLESEAWGSLTMGACLEAVGRDFEATGLRVNVNDLSQQHGQNGLDADFRYVRRDGRDAALDLRYHPELYDAVATQDLMQLIIQHCPVEVIFADLAHLHFSNSALSRDHHVLRQASGHSNHFHVRLRSNSGGITP